MGDAAGLKLDSVLLMRSVARTQASRAQRVLQIASNKLPWDMDTT